MVEYVCRACGKICTAKYKSQIKKYCSHKCANVSRWKNTEPKIKTLICETCGKEFKVRCSDSRLKNGTVRFCSQKCAGASNKKGETKECQFCGKKFYTTRHKFCSKECANSYKKQHYKHKTYLENGYIVEYANGNNKNNCIKQHRRIMEEHLGRKLREDEVVHHLNGIKTDNRIENLRVMSRKEHSAMHRIKEKQQGKHLFGGYNNN